jgi:hypothetical protein
MSPTFSPFLMFAHVRKHIKSNSNTEEPTLCKLNYCITLQKSAAEFHEINTVWKSGYRTFQGKTVKNIKI